MSLNVHMVTSRFLPIIIPGKFHRTLYSTGVLNLASVNILTLYVINSVFKHLGEGRTGSMIQTLH